MTKDEKFLIALYKKSRALPEGVETIDPYEVGSELGYNEKLTLQLLRGLMKANFVKQLDPSEIILTSLGEEIAKQLQR